MKKHSDICYRNINGENLLLDMYLPENDGFDVFLFFHGGALEHGSKESADIFAQYLTKRNIAVISADYRKYPAAKYPDFIDDAAYAAAWTMENIKNYGEARRIFIGGSSAGAYLSMMLCFDRSWLSAYNLAPIDFAGFIHNSGQPTTHFNVLRERGLDTRRVVVDEAAPLYHIGRAAEYPPMVFMVASEDVENRYEQTQLVLSTLRHFRYDVKDISYKLIKGIHCAHDKQTDEDGNSVFGKLIYDFIDNIK